MKLLIIGIDGGDERIFSKLDMPFFNEFLKNNTSLKVKEDLWSRGWANVLAGEHGRETGAFYTLPLYKDGAIHFTQKFSSKDYYENKKIVPLWDKINNLGYSVGLMNFPTTAPATKISKGFIVSGAGGGLSNKGVGGIPLKACYPERIKKDLDNNNYIFDIRFRASGIKIMSDFISEVEGMQNVRSDSFIDLCKKNSVDVGGIAYMGTSRLQNLALYDINEIINGRESIHTTNLKKLYKSLDDNIKKIYEELKPDQIIFVSDHGTELRKGTINLNEFLNKTGFLTFLPYPERILRKVQQRFFSINKGFPINNLKTKAFTGRYINGIYINDNRFGGAVKPQDKERIIAQIIKTINSYPEFKEAGISAENYRGKHLDSYSEALLPDIVINKPDHLFFEASGKILDTNKDLGLLKEDISHIKRDMFTGIKASVPLVICSETMKSFIHDSDEKNLTVVYKMIARFLGKQRSN